ncbi:MAG: hypothetical protein WBA46_15570 [Thermomicrobiales bacterium]
MPRALARLYVGFGGLNVILLAIGLAEMPAGTRALLAGIWVFGLVEAIKSYAVRLAYPANMWIAEVGRWRTPRLRSEIRSGLRATPPAS